MMMTVTWMVCPLFITWTLLPSEKIAPKSNMDRKENGTCSRPEEGKWGLINCWPEEKEVYTERMGIYSLSLQHSQAIGPLHQGMTKAALPRQPLSSPGQ